MSRSDESSGSDFTWFATVIVSPCGSFLWVAQEPAEPGRVLWYANGPLCHSEVLRVMTIAREGPLAFRMLSGRDYPFPLFCLILSNLCHGLTGYTQIRVVVIRVYGCRASASALADFDHLNLILCCCDSAV